MWLARLPIIRSVIACRKWIIAAAIFVFFVLLMNGIPVAENADTGRYMYLRDHSSGDLSVLWTAMLLRPVLPALLYALFPNEAFATLIQGAISFAAWAYLAEAVSHKIRNPLLSLLAFTVVLGWSCGENVLFWNRLLLSESLSISLFCVFTASLLNANSRRWGYAMVLVSGILLLLTRDVWIYYVPVISLIIFVERPREQLRGKIILYGLLLLATLTASWIAGQGQRFIYPLKNTVYQRVLTDKTALEFFTDHGLPDPEIIARNCAKSLGECPISMEQNDWFLNEGIGTYEAWLLHTLPLRLYEFWDDLPDALPQDLFFYTRANRPPLREYIYRSPIGKTDYPMMIELAITDAILLASCYLLRTLRRPWRPLELWGLGMIILGFGNAFIAYWGDGTSTNRHELMGCLAFTLGFMFVGFSLFDRIFNLWFGQRRFRGEPI